VLRRKFRNIAEKRVAMFGAGDFGTQVVTTRHKHLVVGDSVASCRAGRGGPQVLFWPGYALVYFRRSLQRPVRITKELARNHHKIRLAGSNDVIRLRRAGDEANGSGRHARFTPDAIGKRSLKSRSRGDFCIRDKSAGGNIHQIHLMRFQNLRERNRLVDIPAALNPIGCPRCVPSEPIWQAIPAGRRRPLSITAGFDSRTSRHIHRPGGC
jgi:hypothetical protein